MGTLQENRTLDYEEERNKRIRILEERLEEYQKYIDINHKEIERLNKQLQLISDEFLKYDWELSSKGQTINQLKSLYNSIFKGSDKE